MSRCNTGNEGVVIGWINGGNRYQQFFHTPTGTLYYFNFYDGSWYSNPGYLPGLDVNTWHHVVTTYQKTGTNSSIPRVPLNLRYCASSQYISI